ncbi:hypothetical protein [Solimonas soli]|uniref:hypothetical protein n=1 Tax=Solimonas soli TaxID=413479 RepID=UPI0004B351DB|nr:hypothetical protein [Solimonas soli]
MSAASRNLQGDLQAVRDAIGLPQRTPGRLNASVHDDYRFAARAPREAGIEVINASPDGALPTTVFPRRRADDMLGGAALRRRAYCS